MKGLSNAPPSTGGSQIVPPLADAPPPDVAGESSIHGMPSRASARERADSGQEASAADAVSGSSIEQLREIIVGAQLREYERRFARMESRLASELGEIREEVNARFTALEQHVRDELESVAVELRATQQLRATEERRLSESITEVANGADSRIAELTNRVTGESRELRLQLQDQTKAITDDVERRHAELLALLERDASELRVGKADRADLSELFMEVALRLRGESVPETEKSGRR